MLSNTPLKISLAKESGNDFYIKVYFIKFIFAVPQEVAKYLCYFI